MKEIERKGRKLHNIDDDVVHINKSVYACKSDMKMNLSDRSRGVCIFRAQYILEKISTTMLGPYHPVVL